MIPIYYYHPDHLGTSTALTDFNGNAYQFFLNLPFGETMAEQLGSNYYNSPFKFNGKELDEETGFYYYGARYYDPKTSIWLSVDPLVEQTMDAYGYCYQNPVNLIDPSGMQGEDPKTEGVPWWKKTLVKAAFTHPLPRLFIENYCTGKGKYIMLNELGMNQVEPMPVSINKGNSGAGEAAKIRKKEMDTFNKFLSEIKPEESKYIELSVLNKAQNQGTLGSFTVYFQGILTKDKDGVNWNFEGQMSFYDFWNFDKKSTEARTKGSHDATQDGADWLEGGTGFAIYSHNVKVKQTSKDKHVDWWKNKKITEIRAIPNQLKKIKENFLKLFE